MAFLNTNFILQKDIIDCDNQEFMPIIRSRDKLFQLGWCNQLEFINDSEKRKKIEDWEWEEEKFYCKVFLKYRNENIYKEVLEYLYNQSSLMENELLAGAYCKIYYGITYNLINEMVNNNFTTEQFSGLYCCVHKFSNFGERVSNRLAEDIYRNNDLFQAGKIVELLDKRERIYIVLYQLISHSIYDFRQHWNYLNIQELYHLIPDTFTFREDVECNQDYLFNRLKNSNMGHKIHSGILNRLILYLSTPLTMELLEKIYQEEMINPYYYMVIAGCVLNQRFMELQSDFSKIDRNVLKGLLSFLTKNTYLLNESEIEEVVGGLFYISYKYFYTEQDLPWVKNLILEELLILRPNLSEKLIYSLRETRYYVSNDFITYVFVYCIHKSTLGLTQSMKTWIRKRILCSNVNDCKTIEAYIEKIHKILQEFGWSLSLWEIEGMRGFLSDNAKKR